MLKKTITYEDFNGDTVSEDFFFHLSKAELVELELSHDGGLAESLKRIVEAEDGKAIIAEFKNIILSSYGTRSADGRRFMKSQTIRDEFESTEAYSSLFMELVTDADAAIEFVNGIIPKDMAEEAARISGIPPTIAEVPEPVASATETRVHVYTREQVDAMSGEEALEVWEFIKAGTAKIEE